MNEIGFPITDRLAYAESRLREQFLHEVGCAVALLEEDDWKLVERGREHYTLPFGYDAPEFIDEKPFMRVALCPQRIVAQTEHLDDEAFGAYIETVIFYLNMSIGFFFVGEDTQVPRDPAEREHQVINHLYDEVPHALALMTEVQVRVFEEPR